MNLFSLCHFGVRPVLLLGLTLLFCFTPAVHAQRVALLIGNASYQAAPLTNPPNDVRVMEAALIRVGFKVQKVFNANQNQMKRAVRDFGDAAQGAEVALIYYSGHGTQANGENYLLPVGAVINKETDYEVEAVAANALLRQIAGARPKAAIVVLDACRDNPYASATKSTTKGLARMDAPTGTMIAFATSPGTTAADEGYYARVLAEQITIPGQELIQVFRNTGNQVRKLSKGKQEPRISEVSINDEVYLAGHRQVASIRPESVSQVQQAIPTERPQLAPLPTTKPDAAAAQAARPAANSPPNGQVQLSGHVDPFADAFDELYRVISRAPLSFFVHGDGTSPNERERSDFLTTVQIRKEMLTNKTRRHVVNGLIETLQSGEMSPLCPKGFGNYGSCVDLDRWLSIPPNLVLSLKLSQLAVEQKIAADGLARHYQNGWGVDRDLLKSYDLYMLDKKLGSEYYWTDINKMVQKELVGLGHAVKADGDFGSESCKALASIIGQIKCGRTVSREHLEKLVAMKGASKF